MMQVNEKGATMKTWDKIAWGLVAGIGASQLIRARKAHISYAAQFVEDTLSVVSEILPGQRSNYDRLYNLAYNQNVVPTELSWGKRALGFDYLDDMTDTFVVEAAEATSSQVVFYLTGGGYWLQPTIFHFAMVRKLADKVKGQVVVPLFPKGPTYHIADAHQMILARYMYLLNKKKIDAKNITIMGDSTGGALAVAFMQQLRDAGLPLPGAAVLISPLLDGSLQNVAVGFDQVDYEPFLQPKLLELETVTFAKPFSAINPLISPWYGSFEGLPPMQIVIGTRDMTLTYIAVLKDRAERENLAISFDVYPHMAHIFPIYPIPEADQALDSMVAFIEQVSERD